MRTRLLVAALPGLALLALTPAAAVPQDFTIPSRAEVDSSFQGNVPQGVEALVAGLRTREDAERYPFAWWRDTTNQNALWMHTRTSFTNSVVRVYQGASSEVLVFLGMHGSNVVAIAGPTGYALVGTGGSRAGAKVALHAFASALGVTDLHFQEQLVSIIYPDARPESFWGGAEFLCYPCDRTQPVMIYASAPWVEAALGTRTQAVRPARVNRDLGTMGPQLAYGPNGNLGTGSSFAFAPYQADPGYYLPNRLIPAETTYTMGGVSVRMIPLNAEFDGGLWLYLPNEKVLVGGDLLGGYFPPVGAITGPDIPARKWIATLDLLRVIGPDVLVPVHGLPVSGSEAVLKVLTDQRDALKSVHDQTVEKINQMMPLDDIVATVQIPEP
jgi:alkyl sulfatase BDS1-like metallo-beta-lactamase superfamily hydrolase